MNPPAAQPGEAHCDPPLRIAMVTRRFWPISGTTESAAGEIASAMNSAGHAVEVFTIRWEKSWPLFFEFQGLPIHRITRPLNSPWGGFRYLRSLARELTEMAPDGIIVFGLGDEAWTIAKAFGKKIPFVIRIDSRHVASDSNPASLTSRQLNALATAQRLIVDSRWTADQILQLNSQFGEKTVIAADPVFSESLQYQPAIKKNTARVAISDAHPVLMIEPDQPLVVTGAAMNGDKGVLDLVSAWPRVLRRFPKARLWILGEGKKTRRVWDLILEKQMVHSVIMPGSFDELRDVFRAADVYVHPLRSSQSCSHLKLAMATGACCIVTKTEMGESLIQQDVNGLLFSPESTEALAEALIHLLSNENVRSRLGQAASRTFSPADDATSLHHFLAPFLNPSVSEVGSQSQESNSD